MASQSIAFVIKRFFIVYSTRASVALVIVVLCIPMRILIRKNHQNFRIFFAYQATLALKAAQLIQWNLLCLAFCIVLAMAQPVVRRSLEHLIQYKTSTFCLKCHISRLCPSTSSDQVVISNSKFAVISASVSLNTLSTTLSHSLSCSVHSRAMQGAESNAINLYQHKNADLLPTRKTFVGARVLVQPSYTLSSRRPCSVAIRSELPLPWKEIEKVHSLIAPTVEALAAADVPAARIYYETYKLAMTVPLKKAYNQKQRQEFYFALLELVFAKRTLIEDEYSWKQAEEVRKQQAHDLEIRHKEAAEKRKEAAEKRKEAAEKRLAAEEQRCQELHNLEVEERKNMCKAIKEASSQQNLSAENIDLTCKIQIRKSKNRKNNLTCFYFRFSYLKRIQLKLQTSSWIDLFD